MSSGPVRSALALHASSKFFLVHPASHWGEIQFAFLVVSIGGWLLIWVSKFLVRSMTVLGLSYFQQHVDRSNLHLLEFWIANV